MLPGPVRTAAGVAGMLTCRISRPVARLYALRAYGGLPEYSVATYRYGPPAAIASALWPGRSRTRT